MGVGGGEGKGLGSVWGVSEDVNEKLKFFVKIQKKKSDRGRGDRVGGGGGGLGWM